MSATVYADARYGIKDDSAATGMKLANLSYSSSASEAVSENHLGSEDGLAIYNDMTEVSADGVVAVKATGLDLNLADVIVLANTTDAGNTLTDPLFTTSVAGAGTIITSLDLTRNNKGFETGSMSGKYRPLVNATGGGVVT